MKNKIILTILSVMLLSITACGSKENALPVSNSSTEDTAPEPSEPEKSATEQKQKKEERKDEDSKVDMAYTLFSNWLIGSDLVCKYYDERVPANVKRLYLQMPDSSSVELSIAPDDPTDVWYKFNADGTEMSLSVYAVEGVSVTSEQQAANEWMGFTTAGNPDGEYYVEYLLANGSAKIKVYFVKDNFGLIIDIKLDDYNDDIDPYAKSQFEYITQQLMSGNANSNTESNHSM